MIVIIFFDVAIFPNKIACANFEHWTVSPSYGSSNYIRMHDMFSPYKSERNAVTLLIVHINLAA